MYGAYFAIVFRQVFRQDTIFVDVGRRKQKGTYNIGKLALSEHVTILLIINICVV